MARAVWLVAVTAVLATLVPTTPAAACSCAETSLEETVARMPDAVVALVRRVDDGSRRGAGVGRVLARLHGEAPAVLPLELDTGASCRPHLGVGHVAALTFRPRGGGWETLECGRLDAASSLGRVFGDLAPDPDATGPPGLVVAGAFPGADLVTLDARLRVLATASVEGWVERLVPCGDGVVVLRGEDLVTVVEERTLPDLEVTRSSRIAHRDGWRALAVRCTDDGRVEAVARSDLPEGRGWFHRDLLGDEEGLPVPGAEAAAFVADVAWLLVTEPTGDSSRIDVVDLATGAVTTRATLPGMSGYELAVAPDARHVAVRGYADASVLVVLDTATATPTGRTVGGDWMPTGSGWLGPGTLVLGDESGRAAVPTLRLADTSLRVTGEVPPVPGWPLAAADGTLVVGGGAELAVRRPDGSLHASPDLRLTAAGTALVVGPVTGPDAEFVAGAPATGGISDTSGAAASDGGGSRRTPATSLGAAVALAAVGAAAVTLLARRGRSGPR
jgi:hypothetical protein